MKRWVFILIIGCGCHSAPPPVARREPPLPPMPPVHIPLVAAAPIVQVITPKILNVLFATVTNAEYKVMFGLETSTNLLDWREIFSCEGTGDDISVPQTASNLFQFYRVKSWFEPK